MLANEIKLIANAAQIADFEIDENNPLFEVYEKAYEAMLDYARENPDEFEVVEGEFSNHWSHVSAQSKDGTEYECDGQIIDGNEEGGEIVGDFIDQDGKIVLVIFRDDKIRYMHIDTGAIDTEENWINKITDEEIEEKFLDGTSKKDAFEAYVHERKFVEVRKDVHGNWVEIK